MAAKRGIVRRSGFTLLEALVALIMFTLIMIAIDMALNTAMRAQVITENTQTDNGNVRSIFDALNRDIAGAVVSVTDTQAAFVSGQQSGSSSTSSTPLIGVGSLLTLETRTQRVLSIDPNLSDDPTIAGSGGGVFSGSNTTPNPEYDALFVRYDLDPSSGNLTRTTMPVPNGQLLTGPTGQISNIVGHNIVSMTFQYWDSTQQLWRPDWDYEEPNIITAISGTTSAGTTGTSGTSSATTAAAVPSPAALVPTTTGTSGDMILPLAVQVTLVVRSSTGRQLTYTTTIAIPAPMPGNATPPTTAAPAPGSTGSTGTGG